MNFLKVISASCIVCLAYTHDLLAQENNDASLKLVGNKVVTYIDGDELPARQVNIVAKALKDVEHAISSTTQAWYGSGLRNGTFNGYIDHYSLNPEDDDFVYSKPYMQFSLHLGSKTSEVQQVALLDQLARARVGIETRFANTDTLRGVRSVSWARSQVFYENIRALADKRVDFILADKDMIQQFNLLLAQKDEELIYLSDSPMYVVDVSLAISTQVPNAEAIIKAFDDSIERMRESGELSNILKADNTRSLLNPVVYKDILRKW